MELCKIVKRGRQARIQASQQFGGALPPTFSSPPIPGRPRAFAALPSIQGCREKTKHAQHAETNVHGNLPVPSFVAHASTIRNCFCITSTQR